MISPYLFSTLQRKLTNCPTCIFWSIPGQTSAFQSRYQGNIAQQSALRIHGQTNPRIILEGSVWMLVYKIFQQMHDPPQADWEDYFLAILVTNSFQETDCFVTIFLIPTYLYCVHITFSCKVNGLSTMKKKETFRRFSVFKVSSIPVQSRPGTWTFVQVPDPSRPKLKNHLPSGPDVGEARF